MSPNKRRQRLIPWLKELLDSPNSTVTWLCKRSGIFKIPWKHNRSSGWSKDTSDIFKMWAIFSGKYKNDRPEDWTMWKTRLRCALTRLSGIAELRDSHDLSGPTPYKVYKFLDATKDDQVVDEKEDNNPNDLWIQDAWTPDFEEAYLYSDQNATDREVHIDDATIVTRQDTKATDELVDPMLNGDSDDALSEAVAHFPISPTALSPTPLSPTALSPTALSPTALSLYAEPTDVVCSEAGGLGTFCDPDTMLQVKIQYLGEAKVVQTVAGERGCRLYYCPQEDDGSWVDDFHLETCGDVDEVEIKLPEYNETCLTPIINKVLKSLDRGVVIRCERGNIWATRYTKCSIFWRDNSTGKWLKLARSPYSCHGNIATKIFDWNIFEKQIRACQAGERETPAYDVLLSLGHCPNPSDRINHLAVSMTVVNYQAISAITKLSLLSPKIQSPLRDCEDDWTLSEEMVTSSYSSIQVI